MSWRRVIASARGVVGRATERLRGWTKQHGARQGVPGFPGIPGFRKQHIKNENLSLTSLISTSISIIFCTAARRTPSRRAGA